MTRATSNKSILRIIFLTLFLDLVGFSIVFPLFPHIAKFYLQADSGNTILQVIFTIIDWWQGLAPQSPFFTSMVLFGGVAGSIYSIMQFIFSPVWGTLSDRIGRRRVLLLTTAGTVVSYLIWMLSGSFTAFFIFRLVSGVMGGNIATATIVVADITSDGERSKGMAIIGIAFALGFILGPAIGGVLATYSVGSTHPFTLVAAAGFGLAILNWLLLWHLLPETNSSSKVSSSSWKQKWLPFLFNNFSLAVRRVNRGYFLYLMIFSGMEFTLTFLSYERFKYSGLDNALLFIFSGVIIAGVQGGIVRRYAHQVGELKLIKWGMISVILGLGLIGQAYHIILLYGGLLFLSLGAAIIIPCITALVTLYATSEQQGEVVGVFRAYGALARVVGPIMATILYWNFGSVVAYEIGGGALLIPLWLLSGISAV